MHASWLFSSGSSVFVGILMLIGTAYDYYLSFKAAKRRSSIYDLEKHAKLEQAANGHHKLANGEEIRDKSSYFFLITFIRCTKISV